MSIFWEKSVFPKTQVPTPQNARARARAVFENLISHFRFVEKAVAVLGKRQSASASSHAEEARRGALAFSAASTPHLPSKAFFFTIHLSEIYSIVQLKFEKEKKEKEKRKEELSS